MIHANLMFILMENVFNLMKNMRCAEMLNPYMLKFVHAQIRTVQANDQRSAGVSTPNF